MDVTAALVNDEFADGQISNMTVCGLWRHEGANAWLTM
jgi:hypothetical protein